MGLLNRRAVERTDRITGFKKLRDASISFPPNLILSVVAPVDNRQIADLQDKRRMLV